MERLGAQDLSMVLPEEFGWPQDIGALGILDGSHLLEAGGRFPIEAVRERIGRRLHLLARFRQLLYTPRRGLGWPLWVDAPAFNIADHVAVFPRGAPGRRSCWRPARSCGNGGWTGPTRCGRCCSCQAWQRLGSA
jgi:diacylglycerol O-acyltransferase / wax synthase